jgi:hypothetical protein
MKYLESGCKVSFYILSEYAKSVYEGPAEKQYNCIEPMILAGGNK